MKANYFHLNQWTPTRTKKFWCFWVFAVWFVCDALVSWGFQSWQWKLTARRCLEFRVKQIKKSWSTPIMQNTKVFSLYLHVFTEYLTILFLFLCHCFLGYPRAYELKVFLQKHFKCLPNHYLQWSEPCRIISDPETPLNPSSQRIGVPLQWRESEVSKVVPVWNYYQKVP